jgi:hypothetical protein
MKKEELIEFIKELGFRQTWTTKPNLFSMPTDLVGFPNSNYQAFVDQLSINIDDDKQTFQLSLQQLSTHMMSGKNFGYFNLNTFGDENDLQILVFMSFIKGSFNKVPNTITKYIRDKKIKDILK